MSAYKQSWSEAKVESRFWSKVDKTDECWVWTAGVDRDGYGMFRFPWATIRAHRVAYEWEYGPIPAGLVLDHQCDNPGCVRPTHLVATTNRVNILRGTAPTAVNAAKTHCVHGHPFDEANTYVEGSKRRCRTCGNERQRRYVARHRSEVS